MGKKCGFFNINFLPSVQTDANDDWIDEILIAETAHDVS